MSLTDLIPAPNDADVNGNASPCPTAYLIRKYGLPRPDLNQECQPATATFWKERLVTKNVGPFKVTGHRNAVALLSKALADVKLLHPELYAVLGTAGMFCCRFVRNSRVTPSNHALGLAVDFTISGQLDAPGNGKVQRGLFILYSVMKLHGFYWGVEFGREDAMHFEVSSEVVMDWVRANTF